MNGDLVKWTNTAVKLNVPSIFHRAGGEIWYHVSFARRSSGFESPRVHHFFLEIPLANESNVCYNIRRFDEVEEKLEVET